MAGISKKTVCILLAFVLLTSGCQGLKAPSPAAVVKVPSSATEVKGTSPATAIAKKGSGIEVKPMAKLDLRFPGPVSKNAKPIKNVIVPISLDVPDYTYMDAWWPPQTWRSTGLYAAPGEKITITIPQAVAGLYVQIGSHTDTLREVDKASRLRAPSILITQQLKQGNNTVINPYGGLIYVIPTIPNSNPKILTSELTLSIAISGAIKAPFYELGVTTDDQWQAMIEDPSAPMAELKTSQVILTVPSKYLKAIEDPKKLMEKWDEFVGQVNWLAGYTTEQSKSKTTQSKQTMHQKPKDPWRFVADIQISYGYMYAGYPIMLYGDEAIQDMLSIEGLTKRGWGYWHELGHNFQQKSWEVDSMVEVTNNIYSLYIQEYFGNPSRLLEDNDGTGHSSFEDAITYVKTQRSDKNFQDDKQTTYFTRLVMFWQLKSAYGWELYPKLARYFREQPRTEEELSAQIRVDNMIAAFCILTGDDLVLFFEHWGLKPSQMQKEKLKVIRLKPLSEILWLKTM